MCNYRDSSLLLINNYKKNNNVAHTVYRYVFIVDVGTRIVRSF